MDRVADYLRIPSGYAEAVDQLGWSAAGDAIEFWNRETFALTPEILGFLEGFASQRPLVPFAHVLHLQYLLRRGCLPSSPHDFSALSEAFRKAGMNPRNAGVFCAVLCRGVPPALELPSAEELPRQPGFRSLTLEVSAAGERDGDRPPLAPGAFEKLLSSALRVYTFAELVHWFRHGQGPAAAAGERVARGLPAAPPATLRGVLATLVQSARLAGAVPFVEQLVSALDLPPRRRDHHELATGGYWDVVTRGHPEQILPSQFALDDLEFLRRHAENELLYYHREEPHVRTREELVVLLDQGVRTWGTVRVVLAAAVLALARLAERRRLPFTVAATR
jgi:hypothetical protein